MEQGAFSSSDLKSGERLLKEQRVRSPIFSHGSYQVEVEDKSDKKSYYPFFQFDEKGALSERFCSCKKAEKGGSCPHLAAAFLAIYQGHTQPLHIRFEKSFWNKLFWIAFHRHGSLVKGTGKFSHFYGNNLYQKPIFSIETHTAKISRDLSKIIEEHREIYEEDLLHFSALSETELNLWRSGHPTARFQYELSFFSELAKWVYMQAENGASYAVEFTEKEGELPSEITIAFEGFKIILKITRSNWLILVPTLTTINSPLNLFTDREKMARSATFFPIRGELEIDYVLNPAWSISSAQIPIENWLYLPGRGFFPKEVDFNEQPLLNAEQIGHLLTSYPDFLKRLLPDGTIHQGKYTLSYTLFFDPKVGLTIDSYLFEKGDITHSLPFGDWIYIQGKGFYRLSSRKFDRIHKIIPLGELSHFLTQNRLWLGSFDGFQTHMVGLDSKFTYTFTDDQALLFRAQIDMPFDDEVCDIDDWIYLRGRGFFSKITGSRALRSNLTIPEEKIFAFIEANRDELDCVEGFFSSKNPVEKLGIALNLTGDGTVVSTPLVSLYPGYRREDVHFFGTYTYVKGEGFYQLPANVQLPKAFTAERTVEMSELEMIRSYVVEMDPRLVKPLRLKLRVNQLRRDLKKGRGSFVAALEYVSEYGSFSPFLIWEALGAKKESVFSPGGLILVGEKRFQWLQNYRGRKWLKKGDELRVSTLDWMKLLLFEEVLPPEKSRWGAVGTTRLMKELESLQSSETLDLSGLKSELRPYQESGLKWLWFLYCNGLSGMLCDDMGLGKTHQGMALLAAACNHLKNDGSKGRFLVVCPTSVLYHWEALLARFFPQMKVTLFHGSGRNLREFFDNGQLLLTSYGTLRQEEKGLFKMLFDVAIFDEVQIAKNARSQTHKTLKAIQANMRLGLSGTPVENDLFELKALFDLVVPGLLPPASEFRDLFMAEGSERRRGLLKKWIYPFILRRKKSEVLLELPSKTEEISYCALSDEQKGRYSELMESSRLAVIEQLTDGSKPVPYIHVFALLSKLKQLCNHPALESGHLNDYKEHASGKWDLFCEIIDEAIGGGQKVVVFSQYLGMLDIIEKYLKEKKIKFAGIRGNTRDRKEELARFATDPACLVFVASLQAAGVGVDLVAASVVIHYDRWWNPAKENQATDRVHRMGQSRGVQVFKMVCKNSVEERIHELIEKKKGLAESVIGYDDQEAIKQMSRSDLIYILT